MLRTVTVLRVVVNGRIPAGSAKMTLGPREDKLRGHQTTETVVRPDLTTRVAGVKLRKGTALRQVNILVMRTATRRENRHTMNTGALQTTRCVMRIVLPRRRNLLTTRRPRRATKTSSSATLHPELTNGLTIVLDTMVTIVLKPTHRLRTINNRNLKRRITPNQAAL